MPNGKWEAQNPSPPTGDMPKQEARLGQAERAHRGPLFIISGSEESRASRESLRVRARPMSLASGVSAFRSPGHPASV